MTCQLSPLDLTLGGVGMFERKFVLKNHLSFQFQVACEQQTRFRSSLSLPREATTGNASAVRRLSFRLSRLFFGKHGCVSSSDFASIVFIARLALSSLEFPFALVNSEAEIRHVVSWELIFGPEIFLGFDFCLHRLSRSNFRIIS